MKRFTRRWSCAVLSATLALHGPASVVLAMPAPVRVVQDDTDENHAPPGSPAEFQTLYQSVFEQLFQTPYDASEWTYPLSGPVVGAGDHHGSNQYGQPFTLEVLIATDGDIENTEGLTEEQIAQIETRQLSMWGVIGRLTTDLASIPVHGLVISGVVNGVMDHRMVITYLGDPNSYVFNPPVLTPSSAELPPDPVVGEPQIDTTPVLSPDYQYLLDLPGPSDELREVTANVFASAFGQAPADGVTLQIPLDMPVVGPGGYSGSMTSMTDGPSENYMFYAQTAESVDVKALSCIGTLAAEQLVATGYDFHLVSGTLEGDSGYAHVVGVTASSADGGAALTVLRQSEQVEIGVDAEQELCCAGIWVPLFVPYICYDADCVDACKAAYEEAKTKAFDELHADKAKAKADHLARMNTANSIYLAAKTAADTAYAAAIGICLLLHKKQILTCTLLLVLSWWSGPGAFLACLAIFVAEEAACHLAADVVHHALVANAKSAYEAAKAASEAQFTADLAAANAKFQAAMAAAEQALKDCIETCKRICWLILWIWIPLCW